MAHIHDKILEEFHKSNFKKSYDLALSLNHEDLNENILKILTISSFNLQKYSDSIKYGLILFEKVRFEKANGEPDPEKSDTLGLKSMVSDALTPESIIGISVLYLSSVYESIV